MACDQRWHEKSIWRTKIKRDTKEGIYMSSKRTTLEDVKNIRNVYSQCHSIERTIELTGWSRCTVHKYVRDLSCQHPSSKYNHRRVLKLDINTKKIISSYKDLAKAARLTEISISNIDHCLRGNTNTAGGYCWQYEADYKKETPK